MDMRGCCCLLLITLLLLFDHYTIIDGADHGRGGSYCLANFQFSNSTIIKSRESTFNGARYLGSVEGVSQIDCQYECCQLTDCNVVVYHQTGTHDCYLFQCGVISDVRSQCVFSKHDDYTAIWMIDNNGIDDNNVINRAANHEQKKHENELNQLKTNIVSSSAAELSKQRKRPPPLDPTEPQESLFDNKHPMASSQQRASCNIYQWQCDNGQCIGVYDACDGIVQCTDRSDENTEMCNRRRLHPPALDIIPATPKPQPIVLPAGPLPGDSASKIGPLPGDSVPKDRQPPPPTVKSILMLDDVSSSSSLTTALLGAVVCLLAICIVCIWCRSRRPATGGGIVRNRRGGGKAMQNSAEDDLLIKSLYL